MSLPLAAVAAVPIDITALLLVLAAAWSAGALASRWGYPAVLGELLAGIILGPPLLGLLSSGEGLDAVGELGIILMMLYVGTEIDLDDLRRASRAGIYAAIGGFVLPFALGAGVILLLRGDWIAAVFVGSAMGVTSLATKSRILADLRLFDTRIAYVLVAGALLSDTATLVIFAAVLSLAGEGGLDLASTGTVALEAVAFFVVVWIAGRHLVPRIARRFVADGTRGLAPALVLFIGVGLGAAVLAQEFGLHPILGSFVAGIFLKRSVSDRTARDVAHQIERISIGVLAPVFFVTAGFAISLDAAVNQWPLLLAIVALATVGKVVGTALAYLPTGHGWREGTVVGAAMNGRGAVEIIVAGIGLEVGLIDQEIFTVLVLMAVLTTAAVPVMLKKGVEWLRSRDELVQTGRRTGITIVGAGPLGRTLATMFGSDRDVWLVDTNEDRCRRAQGLGLNVVHGNALDAETLRRSRVDEAGLLLCLTPNAEVNVLTAKLAFDEYQVPETRIAAPTAGLERTTRLLEDVPARPFVEGGIEVADWDRRLSESAAEPSTVVVVDDPSDGRELARLRSGAAGVPVAVVRNGEVLPFPLIDELRLGDHVTLVVDKARRVVDAPVG